MVIWVTGLSGAGKSTFANALKAVFDQCTSRQALIIDGDFLRQIEVTGGYDLKSRDRSSYQIARLACWMDQQGIDVICALIGCTPGPREWSRKNVKNFREVHLSVPVETLIKRDSKGLYQKAREGLEKNVVGWDIDYHPPHSVDKTIANQFDSSVLGKQAFELLLEWGVDLKFQSSSKRYDFGDKWLKKFSSSRKNHSSDFKTWIQEGRAVLDRPLEDSQSKIHTLNELLSINDEIEKRLHVEIEPKDLKIAQECRTLEQQLLKEFNFELYP